MGSRYYVEDADRQFSKKYNSIISVCMEEKIIPCYCTVVETGNSRTAGVSSTSGHGDRVTSNDPILYISLFDDAPDCSGLFFMSRCRLVIHRIAAKAAKRATPRGTLTETPTIALWSRLHVLFTGSWMMSWPTFASNVADLLLQQFVVTPLVGSRKCFCQARIGEHCS